MRDLKGLGAAGTVLCAAAGVLALGQQAQAQEKEREFAAAIHVFFSPDLYAAWRQGNGEAYTEATRVPDKIADVPFLIMVSATDCTAARDGRCNVTADYELFGPDGSRAIQDKGRKVWTKTAQPNGVMTFSEEPIPAMLQVSDPRGPYRLHVTFHDNVSGRSVEQERTLVLEPAG